MTHWSSGLFSNFLLPETVPLETSLKSAHSFITHLLTPRLYAPSAVFSPRLLAMTTTIKLLTNFTYNSKNISLPRAVRFTQSAGLSSAVQKDDKMAGSPLGFKATWRFFLLLPLPLPLPRLAMPLHRKGTCAMVSALVHTGRIHRAW